MAYRALKSALNTSFMKKYFIILLILGLAPVAVKSASLSQKLSGRILLNVEGYGEAWYINPADNRRYYLGRPDDAFRIMRELSLGINNEKLATIRPAERDMAAASRIAGVKVVAESVPGSAAAAEVEVKYDSVLTKSLLGKILLQVEGNGEAWYINPTDEKRYYLGRPSDAFRIMRELSLGISREDLAKIHKPGASEAINQYSGYEHKKITANGKEYSLDLITIDLLNPGLKIITDTASDADCEKNCPAKSLAKFALDNNAFAGINGSYFCSSGSCNYNYYFYPVYNSRLGVMINEDQCKYWTTGPIFVFDTNNKFYYFKDSREFKSVADFEKNYGVKLQAAIGNKPRLIQDYMNYLIEWEMDKKQLETKAVRNAIGYLNNKLYLVAAYNATVPELADIMKTFGVEYALNLDGGYSNAVWYNDEYMAGPGRDIPNAILFKEE